MASVLVTDIGELVTCDSSAGDGSMLGVLHDAAFVAEDGRVAWVGPAASAPATDERVSAEGSAVIPGFVDSHTHLVFAGDRSAEFAARMAGEPYTGGGISTTVAATRAATDEELAASAHKRLAAMHADGTTTVEVKGGYGLDVETERRIMKIARGLTSETTFLGAHVVPPEYADDRDAYVDLVCGEMFEAIFKYTKWVDVFCDEGAFTAEETRRILRHGAQNAKLLRLHGNQLGYGPGAQVAAEFQVSSLDHCTYLTDDDVAALRDGGVVATLLPGAEFSTRSPYPDARRLLDAGITVALATDCNPGSAYVTSMPLMIALAVREMHMTPAEALFAATSGSALSLERTDIGCLKPGSSADFAILDAPSHLHLAYRPGSRLVAQTWVRGERVV
ncbi:MAG TPA: imidazolonepropionase [Coriobacteriia bacterium]|nr:imidazolonepropionase [Coriobacteriia bacterium]